MKIFIATNNGDIGGGEVMLLNLARAVRASGYQVTVVGPSEPGELLEAAQDEGFSTVTLPASNRKQYISQLRIWASRLPHECLLWCNGLVPSAATAGLKNRIVHLHQIPEGKNRLLTYLARQGAKEILVPSQFAADKVAKSRPFYNWVYPTESFLERPRFDRDQIRVGFLGRPSTIKGTDLLAEAIFLLNQSVSGRRYRLVLAGEAKYVGQKSQAEVETSLAKISDVTDRLGWVEPSHLMASIDFLVVPSNWDEVFGLVAAEAMSARVPLIVSGAGALPELVGEKYPWVAQQGDVTSLCDNIENLVIEEEKNPAALAQWTQNLYWRWQEQFSPEAGRSRVGQLLEELR